MMSIAPEAESNITGLRELGITISIDDFGIGYSSFNRLKNLAVDVIKIDCSFIQGLGGEEDNSIVRTMIAMAKTLKVRLTAEGVETIKQFEFLKREGCEEIQGFFFSKPLTTTVLEKLLITGMIFPEE